MDTPVRVARPTDRLQEVVGFYTAGLGLSVLGSFEDHEGFDGTMVGLEGSTFHLEFTRRHGHAAGPAPTGEHLLVFYLRDRERWQAAVDRMQAAGYRAIRSSNPYWNRNGLMFADPDGYLVVLADTGWSP